MQGNTLHGIRAYNFTIAFILHARASFCNSYLSYDKFISYLCVLYVYYFSHFYYLFSSGGSRICQGGRADHGERAERDPKRGSEGGAPSRVQGQSSWWGVRDEAPQKLKALCTF